MKKKRRTIFIFFIIVIAGAAFVAWELFGPTVNVPPGSFFFIRTGANYEEVKDDLQTKNIIIKVFIFDNVARYFNYNKLIKPGKYKISAGMSLVNLIRMLRSGRQTPVNLVITKLRTKEDLAKKIADNFESDSATVAAYLNNPDSLLKYDLDTNNVITAIIPNTYTFKWNTTTPRIFKKLYEEKQRFWNPQREAKAAVLGFTTKDIYILASIVEEETNRLQDKGNVASVYVNRMRSGMRLGADPTVKFALKNFGLKRVYFKHLAFPSPYNTYLVQGLPPGPICTPSIKTIEAVLNEPATDYLYFVAKPDFSGYSNFTNSYEEHKKNAKAYQQALDSIIFLKQAGN